MKQVIAFDKPHMLLRITGALLDMRGLDT